MKCMSRALIHSVALSTSVFCFISSLFQDELTDEPVFLSLVAFFLFFPHHIYRQHLLASRSLKGLDGPSWSGGLFSTAQLALSHFVSTVQATRCHQSPHQSLPEPVSTCSHGLFVFIMCKSEARWPKASLLSPSQENKRTSS